ncbi:MAG: TonB-dependent receptor [Acidobacteria bacterium]|nr:TonB-dependent receptor [Acidobacteriota bacterium]
MNSLAKSLCCALASTFVTLAAFAQATSTGGDIRGTVVDPSGSAMAKARVTLTDDARGINRAVESNADGAFILATVPPGVFKLRVEVPGFTTKVIEGLEVRVGEVVSQLIQMSVSAVSTELVVAADVQAVELERTQQSNTIEQKRINGLPINRRNYLDFALLVPGVVETTSLVDDTSFRPVQTPQSGLSFGGSNGRGNGFFIDGVENYQASGGVRASISQEAAQEFQINRNSFSSEFGNASGGVINIISKAGSNGFHGNLFWFLRHRSIQARNYFDPAKSAFTRTQAGGTLGGALKKDKTFFFVAYERLGRQETNFVPLLQDKSVFTSVTPSQSALFQFLESTGSPTLVGLARLGRAQLTPASNPRVLSLFNSNSGTFPFKEDLNNFSLRLDHRFSDNHSLFFRSNSTWNFQQNSAFGALDGFNRGRSLDIGDSTAVIGDTVVINPRFIMESRLMFNYNQLDVIPTDKFGPEININGAGFFGRQIFLPFDGIERHYQAMQNFTMTKGGHTLKFGYDINPVRNNNRSETFFGGRFTFGEALPLALVLQVASGDPTLPTQLGQLLVASRRTDLVPALSAPITALQSFALNLPVLYQQGFGDPNYVINTGRYSGFLQDTWKVSRNLTLNYGVRYELERHNPVVPRDNNNIAPRLGFAWSPMKDGTLAIRGGYGLYYSQVNSQIAGVADPLSGQYINQVLATANGSSFQQPGAPAGTTWTSFGIYQALLARGVLGNRTPTTQDLANLGINIRPGLPGSVHFGIDPAFENPWAHQASFEIEKGVGPWAISVGYNFNRAAHLARITGRNVRYSGQRLPDGRPLFARINPALLQSNIFTSDANSFYHAGMIQVTRRFTRGLSLNSSYTFSRAIDESTDFNSDYSPQDQLNARAERGLSPFHQKHRFVLSAVYESPLKNTLLGRWSVAPVVQYNSWRPFNLLTGVDSQGDTYTTNKRPAHLGRNMGQGPDLATIDMRLSRRFRLTESGTLEFIAEGFNLLNRTNFRSINNIVGDVPYQTLGSPIVGNRQPASFPLAFTSAQNPRQFQFGLKFYF